MSQKDERNFLEFVFENPNVYAISDVRFPSKDIPYTRDIELIQSDPETHYHFWDKSIVRRLSFQYYRECDDYYLMSPLIQFLRSPIDKKNPGVLKPGRIAWSGNLKSGTPRQADLTDKWYLKLQRWIKKNHRNTFILTSDFNPEIGSKFNRYWVGADAMELSRGKYKLKTNGSPGYSLIYYEKSREKETLALIRNHRRSIWTVRVGADNSGNKPSGLTARHWLGYALDRNEALESCREALADAVPGDEFACLLQEKDRASILTPWTLEEVVALTDKNRDKKIAYLKNKWGL